MSETAVGLFEHVNAADEVVEALHQEGFPASGIRVIPTNEGVISGSGVSESATEFHETVARDLRGMGVTDHEAASYLSRLSSGRVLVIATGNSEQARLATEVMNDFSALEIEEFAGTSNGAAAHRSSSQTVVPAERTPGVAEPSAEATASRRDPDVTAKIEHHRTRTAGARVFSW